MGNYNKWRKILTILMIINICFVLFAKFNKAFASDNISLDDLPPLPVLYESQNFVVFENVARTYYYVCILNDTINNSYVSYDTNSKTLTFPSGSGKTYRTSVNGGSSWTFFDNIQSSNNIDRYGYTIGNLLISSVDIYDDTGTNIVFQKNYSTSLNPAFNNITEIENGNPDGVFISPNDYGVDDTLYFHLLEVVYSTPNSNNDTIFYYLPKIFALDETSPYIRYYLENEDDPYYYISRKELGLSPDSSYLYVLSNSSESYNNSIGIIQEDSANGVYDVVSSDTTGILSYQETIDNNVDNIDDFLRDNNVGDYNLNYNNENSELTSMNNGFFTRLLSLVSDTFDYELADDTVITIPMPHSNKTIELHSNILYNNVNGVIRTIIEAFWFYIFGFYVFKFINKLYIAISSGSILDTFSSSDEAITNNML